MDWFESITGFKEQDYSTTQDRLDVVGSCLRSTQSHKTFAMGEFSVPSLSELRAQAQAEIDTGGRLRVSLMSGDVRKFHRLPELKGALFQVASQFNMLEMTSYELTPEDGVTRYRHDPTQGPACAIAAGAATIYRNYLVLVDGLKGQRADRQINGLLNVGDFFSKLLGKPASELWTMRNGYCLASQEGLKAITALLDRLGEPERDEIRGQLRIGVHQDVQVTDDGAPENHFVSQAFCSALPVAYSRFPTNLWRSFARLVLESAYEATLWAGVCNARKGQSNVVLLTRLGGGAFGNEDSWIHAAMSRALHLASQHPLDVRIVSYREPTPELRNFASEFA